ncbi:MAG: hypothetical protein ACRED9_09115 [Caulobacteraceae bacterium]
MSKAIERTFVGLASPTAAAAGHGAHPCQGLYWRPRRARPTTAVIATHYNVDFTEHYLAPLIAERGLGFLGWNTRFRGAEDLFRLEAALIDIAAGVRWLKEEAKAERIVILGNSGGGSLMGAYQAEAVAPSLEGAPHEAGALASLRPADLFVAVNAHPGRPEVLTNWLDPSVVDETDPVKTDPSLDPFDPMNGPPFSAEFVARYRAAQRARNQRITDWARAELARLNAAGYPDRIFPLFRTWADLRFMDGALDPSARPVPRCYAGDPARANRGPFGIGRASTLRAWLSMWSLETSKCRAELHLPWIGVPSLVVQSTGDVGVFPSDGRAIFAALGSADKTLQTPPGAHYFEDVPGGREALADLVAGWIAERL